LFFYFEFDFTNLRFGHEILELQSHVVHYWLRQGTDKENTGTVWPWSTMMKPPILEMQQRDICDTEEWHVTSSGSRGYFGTELEDQFIRCWWPVITSTVGKNTEPGTNDNGSNRNLFLYNFVHIWYVFFFNYLVRKPKL